MENYQAHNSQNLVSIHRALQRGCKHERHPEDLQGESRQGPDALWCKSRWLLWPREMKAMDEMLLTGRAHIEMILGLAFFELTWTKLCGDFIIRHTPTAIHVFLPQLPADDNPVQIFFHHTSVGLVLPRVALL